MVERLHPAFPKPVVFFWYLKSSTEKWEKVYWSDFSACFCVLQSVFGRIASTCKLKIRIDMPTSMSELPFDHHVDMVNIPLFSWVLAPSKRWLALGFNCFLSANRWGPEAPGLFLDCVIVRLVGTVVDTASLRITGYNGYIDRWMMV